MTTTVPMPQLGLEVTEGLVVEIPVEVGDEVGEGDTLVILSTDKAEAEVHAPVAGVVREIAVAVEETVTVGAPLLILADSAAAARPADPGSRADPAPRRRRVAPIARRAGARLGLDLEAIEGTGPNGRVTLGDVEAAERAAASAPAAAAPATAARSRGEEPLTPMRRAIASRMAASQREIPQYQLVREVDATHLLAQKQAAASAVGPGEAKPSLNDLLIQALAETVARHPELATLYVEPEEGDPVLRRSGAADVGLAVATDSGLLVPVIRQPGRRTLREIAAERARLVERARAGRLDLAEMSGGEITLSNLGGFGVDRFTAMVNPGQAAILAVGRTVERLVPRGRGIGVVPMLTATLSCDHRTVDGAAGGRALATLAELLEGAMAWRS